MKHTECEGRRMKHTECEDCELREGNCGHHFKFSDGTINYNIASLTACDRYDDCMFFKPKAKSVVLSVWEHDSLAELTKYLYTQRVHYCISVTAKGDGRRCTVYSVIIPEITKEQLFHIRDKLRIRIPEV